MTCNELLFIGWDDQHLNSRAVVTDPTFASRVPRRVESSADPCAALDHLRTSGGIILTDKEYSDFEVVLENTMPSSPPKAAVSDPISLTIR